MYLLPGFVTLWGISLFSETVRSWLGSPTVPAPTVGGFLHVTLASLAAGFVVSTARCVVIDRFHQMTGIPEPDWDLARLEQKLPAFDLFVRYHYRYYQAAANGFVAVAFSAVALLASGTPIDGSLVQWSAGVVVVEVLLWLGSRDALDKYQQCLSLPTVSRRRYSTAGRRGAPLAPPFSRP